MLKKGVRLLAFGPLGTIHILRHHQRGGEGIGQMLTFAYEGGRGV